ncbi:23925_t:CDS:2, partial [Gigaspora margarita]
KEVDHVHDKQKILTLKIDKHIAKYIGINDPNFIAIIQENFVRRKIRRCGNLKRER